MFFGDIDSDVEDSENYDDEDYEVKLHEYLGYPHFPLEQYEVSSNIYVFRCNENIHNVSHPPKKLTLICHL